jgi:hypothetical protein
VAKRDAGGLFHEVIGRRVFAHQHHLLRGSHIADGDGFVVGAVDHPQVSGDFWIEVQVAWAVEAIGAGGHHRDHGVAKQGHRLFRLRLTLLTSNQHQQRQQRGPQTHRSFAHHHNNHANVCVHKTHTDVIANRWLSA